MKKIFPLLIIFLFLQSCGYSPIYSFQNKINFKLNIIEIDGSSKMNDIFKIQIKRFSDKTSEKKLDLKIFTYYEKSILTKNKKGEATKFNIKKIINFKIINSENEENHSFNSETIIDNISDKFEKNKYENSIIENFISSSIEKLILKLSVNK
tara:strand:- start:119 stop:574 length:456 start_codon:yes stop_codon:yes gene_type:complete